MIEVLWHGRGGQGAFTAARLLGAAATLKGKQFALAFPSFGPERRGAPMRAFTKISSEPIGDRTTISKADYVVYLDGTLLPPDWGKELKPGGLCLVNAAGVQSDDARLVALDADGISSAVLGRPIPNTVFLGALAALSEAREASITCGDVEEAIRQYMPERLHAKNIQIVQQVHDLVLGMQDAQPDGAANCQSDVDAKGNLSADAPSFARQPHTSAEHVPQLYAEVPAVADYAHTTCFTAGYLTQTNAGWRNKRPVVNHEKCTGCLQCYMVCPDGAIYKIRDLANDSEGESGPLDLRENSTSCTSVHKEDLERKVKGSDSTAASSMPICRRQIGIDLDFCKGCGVCANACKFDALTMLDEQECLAKESEVSA